MFATTVRKVVVPLPGHQDSVPCEKAAAEVWSSPSPWVSESARVRCSSRLLEYYDPSMQKHMRNIAGI